MFTTLSPTNKKSGGGLDISGLTVGTPSLDDPIPFYDESAGANRKADLSIVLALLPLSPGGRITPTQGVPIEKTNVVDSGEIYYKKLEHPFIRLYDGSKWRVFYLDELGMPLSVTDNKVYDVFIFPAYLTPSSTDTTTEVITFAAPHGLATGAAASVSATGGGLTAGVIYFVNVVSPTEVTLHTTLADAIAGANIVNLTASIVAEITFLSMALSAEWTNDTTRAESIAEQDGIEVRDSDHTQLWVGTIAASDTDAVSLNLFPAAGTVAADVGVWNRYNQRQMPFRVVESDDIWAYGVADTWREFNGNSRNRLRYVSGSIGGGVYAIGGCRSIASNVSAVGIGIDSTTSNSAANASVSSGAGVSAFYDGAQLLGLHFVAFLELSQGAINSVFVGDNGVADGEKGGFTGEVTA